MGLKAAIRQQRNGGHYKNYYKSFSCLFFSSVFRMILFARREFLEGICKEDYASDGRLFLGLEIILDLHRGFLSAIFVRRLLGLFSF